MPYYALYDNQTGNYMHTGKNTTTPEELKAALLSYIEPDIDEGEREEIESAGVKSIAAAWDFTIETREEKFA